MRNRKLKFGVRKTHHRTISKDVYAQSGPTLKEQSGKKQKLNQILSRLTKQTESSERRNRNAVNQSFTKQLRGSELESPYKSLALASTSKSLLKK